MRLARMRAIPRRTPKTVRKKTRVNALTKDSCSAANFGLLGARRACRVACEFSRSLVRRAFSRRSALWNRYRVCRAAKAGDQHAPLRRVMNAIGRAQTGTGIVERAPTERAFAAGRDWV